MGCGLSAVSRSEENSAADSSGRRGAVNELAS